MFLSASRLCGIRMSEQGPKYDENKSICDSGTGSDLMPLVCCHVCGYDLRGTSRDARCPECGTPAVCSFAGPRGVRTWVASLPWKRIIPTALALVIAVMVLCGYVRVTAMWYCPDCARVELRYSYEFHLPGLETRLICISGGVRQRPDTLITKMLDPDARCTHSWCPNGYNGKGLVGGYRGIGPDPTMPPIIYADDFGEFVAKLRKDHPILPDEIRQRLRSKDLRTWLTNEYYKWKGGD